MRREGVVDDLVDLCVNLWIIDTETVIMYLPDILQSSSDGNYSLPLDVSLATVLEVQAFVSFQASQTLQFTTITGKTRKVI